MGILSALLQKHTSIYGTFKYSSAVANIHSHKMLRCLVKCKYRNSLQLNEHLPCSSLNIHDRVLNQCVSANWPGLEKQRTR